MILTDLADGESVFLDANILVYHFAPHPVLGQACRELVCRVERQTLIGYTSTAVLSDVAHHLMTFEAAAVFGWASKVVQHLRHDPSTVQQLSKFHQAVAEVPKLGIQVLTIPEALIETARTSHSSEAGPGVAWRLALAGRVLWVKESGIRESTHP